MNRKLAFSLGIIAILLGYIWFSRGTGSRNIPDLPDWEGEATEITINRPDGGAIKLVNEKGKWLLNDEKFPADLQRIEGLENRLRDLEITDLISRKGFFQNYDLTPEKAASITVKQGDRVVRDLMIGKTGTTGRHTYIRINKGGDVYQVSGVFTGETGGTVDDFRDKTVFQVEKEAVTGFAVSYKGKTFTFKKEVIAPEKPSEAEKAKSKIEGSPAEPMKKEKWTCAGYEQVTLNSARIDGLLGTFNPLKASGFAAVDRETMKRPAAVMTIKAYNKDIILTVFDKKEDNRYLATSSESPYVFYLDEWKIKKYFIENLKEYTDNSR